MLKLKVFVYKHIVIIAILTFSLIGDGCHHQAEKIKTRPEVIKIANDIAKENSLEGENVGFGGEKSKQWMRFDRLSKVATNAELRVLTNDKNPVVRCYSFHALALKQDTAIFSILSKHLQDTAQVTMQNYDLIESEMVGDYFIDLVTPGYIDLKTYKLNPSQMQGLDSLMLFRKNIIIVAKERLLHHLKPELKYYHRVRGIALSDSSLFGVVALARYKKPEDKVIINNYLKLPNLQYYAVYAVREFPDPQFYPSLIQIFEKQWKEKLHDYQLWGMLYQALAKYPTSQTVALFEQTVRTKDEFRRQTLGEDLLIAITKYPNPLFEPLKTQIKLDDYTRGEFKQDMSRESEQ